MPNYVESYESDEEVQYIPFVKPPPPLITLVESDNEVEENADPKPKKSKDRKGKKHKRSKSRENEYSVSALFSPDTDINFTSGLHQQTGTVDTECPSNAKDIEAHCGNDAETAVQNVETSNDAHLSSVNVTGCSKALESQSSGGELLPTISTSILESVELTGSKTAPETLFSTCTTVPSSYSAGSANSTGRGGKSTSGKNKQPRRVSASSATKKTATEISKFLNTLGIPVEVRDLVSPRRQRTPKGGKRKDSGTNNESTSTPITPVAAEFVAAQSTLASTGTSSEPSKLDNFQGFVSVSQESTPTRKISCSKSRSAKKSLENKTVDCDDENIITEVELESITTNIQTNMILPGPQSKTFSDQFLTPTNVTLVEQPRKRRRKDSEINKESTILQVDVNEAASVKNVEIENHEGSSEQISHRRQASSDKNKQESNSHTRKKHKNDIKTLEEDASRRGISVPTEAVVNVNPTSTEDIVSGDKRKKIKTAVTPKEKKNRLLVVSRNKAERIPNEPGFPSTWTDEMRRFYGTIRGKNYHEDNVMRNQSDNPELWDASFEYQRRNPVKRVKCDNCYQWGHHAKKCPEKFRYPCCVMCGNQGHTVLDKGANACPECKCLNCGAPNHRFSTGCNKCVYTRNYLRCRLCGVDGHEQQRCPDIWRRYHSTTTDISNINEDIKGGSTPGNAHEALNLHVTEYRRRHESYCANCASKGHDYYNCKASRGKYNPYHRNKPFVIKELPVVTTSTTLPITGESKTHPKIQGSRTVVEELETGTQSNETSSLRIEIQNDIAEPNCGVKASTQTVSVPVTSPQREIKCKNYPDCNNTIGSNSDCYPVEINRCQHNLLINAEKQGFISEIGQRHKCNISILRSKTEFHLWGAQREAAEDEVYQLLYKLLSEENEALDRDLKRANKKDNGSDHVTLSTSSAPKVKVAMETSTHRNVREVDGTFTVVVSKYLSQDLLGINEKALSVETATQISHSDVEVNESGNILPTNVTESLENEIKKVNIDKLSTKFSDSNTTESLPISSTLPTIFQASMPQIDQNSGFDLCSASRLDTDKRVTNTTLQQRNLPVVPPFASLSLAQLPKLTIDQNNCAPARFAFTNPPDSVKFGMFTQRFHYPSNRGNFIPFIHAQIPENKDAENFDTANTKRSQQNDFVEKSRREPELIILDDDDDDDMETEESPDNEGLSVALLASEWDLIFPESLKTDGLLNQLSQQFKVSIYVSKETLSSTIQGGIASDRKKAKDNVIHWLECKAAQNEYFLLPNGNNEGTETIASSPQPQSGNITEVRSMGKLKCKQPRYNPSPNFHHKRVTQNDQTTPNNFNNGQQGRGSRGSRVFRGSRDRRQPWKADNRNAPNPGGHNRKGKRFRYFSPDN